MTSDSRRSGYNTTQATSLGAPSVLIVRLRGDVFPIETTKSIIERNPQLHVLSEFVVPETRAFVPPVGQKFFDPVYLEAQKNLHSKGKVNFSLIKDRDAELRNITQMVADALFKDVLQSGDVHNYTRATLSGINDAAVEIPDSSFGRTALPANAESVTSSHGVAVIADNSSYGVYFREIQVHAPLLQRLVVELKHAGVIAVGGPPHVENVFAGMVPDQWTTAGDTILAANAEKVCFPFPQTGQVLRVLGISSAGQSAEEKEAFDAILQW